MTVADTHPARSGGVFVGREGELTELGGALDDAAAGRGSLFLLAGEPGIGKSRLADELASIARDRGFLVLWGRCWEAGGAPAYWPWVQALRAYVRAADPAQLAEDLGDGSGHVAQMLPDVVAALPDVRLAEVSDPDSARFLLFDATASFLLNASSRRPILLVLDDLHVADTPSLLMLRFVARELERGRVVVVGAYRDPDPERDEPLPPGLIELTREPIARLQRLSGLSEPDVTRFIDRTTGVVPPAALVSAVCEETEGNPLFVGELVRLLAQEGRLSSVPRGVRLAIPESVHDVIGRRLEHLSEPCRSTLSTASVIGREFELELLSQIADRSDREILDHLDEATRARVVGEVPGVAGRFRFAHALIRDTLYDGLAPGARIELHRRTGEAIETLPEEERSSRLAELAHHFSLAMPSGVGERAIDYARKAAEVAASRLAYEEAGRLYELALRSLKATADPNDALRCELLVRRGNAQARYDLAAARDTLAEAAELARHLGRADDLARAALAYGGGFVWSRAGRDRRLVKLLEDALEAMGDRPSPLRVRVLARLASALRDSPDRARGDALSSLAVKMAREIADPRALAYALDGRFGAIWWPENPGERLGIADEFVHIGETLGDPEILFNGHHCRLISFLEIEDIPRVQVELARMKALAEELRYSYMRWAVAITSANLGSLQGRLADEERFSIEAMEVGSPALLTDAESHVASHTYRIRRERNRPMEALETVRRAAEAFTWYPFFRCELADLYLEVGDEPAARALYEDLAKGGCAALPSDNEWIFGLSLLAPVAVRLGDFDGASTIYEMLLPHADRHAVAHHEGTTGSVSRTLGVLATALSRFDEAERHFTNALEHNRLMGAVLWTTYTQHEFARMLLIRDYPGDRERADELHLRALETARAHGFVRLQGEIEALLPVAARVRASVAESHASDITGGIFRREGEYWSVAFDRDAFRLRDSKGLRYLALLLERPGREVHALEMVAAVEGHPRGQGHVDQGLSVQPGDAGDMLDERAKSEYRERLRELESDLAEAEEWNDPERASRLREERDFLVRELALAVGLGGRDRRSASNAERARVNVTRAIRAALDRISEHSPELGRHLGRTVRTGTFCSYQPDTVGPVSWSI